MSCLRHDIFDKCNQVQCANGPLITDKHKGEVLCGSCGQVLIERVEDSENSEYHITLEQYLDGSRTGAPTSLAKHDQGLATTIGYTNKDASGKSLSGYMKATFSRLRTWDMRSKSTRSERNFRQAFMLLDTMKSKLIIPDSVVEQTAYIYRKAVAKRMSRGRTITSLLLASLYAACRATNTPRTLHDIANVANIRKKNIFVTYKKLIKNLDLRLQPYDPIEFVTMVCSIVGLSEKTRRDAISIISKVNEKEIAHGKNPMSLVGAAVYFAAVVNKEKASQRKIAEACGVSSVTLRSVRVMLKEKLKLDEFGRPL